MALKDFTQEKFDILILAGQSNGEGLGFGNASEPYKPSDRVWYLEEDFTLQVAREKVNKNAIQGNLSLSFAREYLNAGLLPEDRKLLILRCAVNGTGFADGRWVPQGDLCLRMQEMIRTALALNPENRLVALLWHQGETEAMAEESYEYYKAQFSVFLQNLRQEFSVPALPFVAGDFCHDWKDENKATCDPIIAALRELCGSLGGAFVETEGLLSNAQDGFPHPQGRIDRVHFCREALYALGQRYFAAFQALTGSK